MLQTLCGLLLLALVPLTAASDAAPVVQQTIRQSPAEVESSWTRADFRNAQPRDPVLQAPASVDAAPVPDAATSAARGAFYPTGITQVPQSLHGKVFFRMGLTTYQCSATLVESKNANSVFTAGHCVYDPPTGEWASEFVFVPGYENGLEPFGRFAAISLNTTQGWFANTPSEKGTVDDSDLDFSEDIAVATLAGSPATALGGAEKIAFDLDPIGRSYRIYGYPGLPSPPYDGERLVACDSTVTRRDPGAPAPLAATPCDMSHGASGGGWVTGGYLNSVVSYVYCDTTPSLCGQIYGPYFSTAAKALYMSEGVGGGVPPTVKVSYSPPKLVTKRRVVFKFAGEASTPLGYLCRFDRRAFVRCGARTQISRLTPGWHTLRVRSIDQTGQRSRKMITRSFRVSLARPRGTS